MPPPLIQLTDIALTFGGTPLLDGVELSVSAGERACLVGRAYLYGLMAGGERGVQRAADILATEIARTLQLLGVASVAELTPDRVRLRP